MNKMDFTKSYGTVSGSSIGAVYEQNERPYDSEGTLIFAGTAKGPDIPDVPKDTIILTDNVESAKAFLRQILKGGPIAKSVVYKESEGNNQSWTDVTAASVDMNLMKFQFKKGETSVEMWKLTEEN